MESFGLFLGLPSLMWAIVAMGVGIASVISWIVHEVFIMNSFAKQARKMKRTKGVPALIQHNNVLKLHFSNAELPEGLYRVGGRWYVRPQTPALVKKEGRGPGRPPKETGENKTVDPALETDVLNKDHREALTEILQVPMLEGVGKPLFIGSVNAPILTNIKTVAHADLTRIREILPSTLSQTWIDALNEYSELKGIKKGTKDQLKIIVLAIAAAIVLGTMGLIVFLILNGGGAA